MGQIRSFRNCFAMNTLKWWLETFPIYFSPQPHKIKSTSSKSQQINYLIIWSSDYPPISIKLWHNQYIILFADSHQGAWFSSPKSVSSGVVFYDYLCIFSPKWWLFVVVIIFIYFFFSFFNTNWNYCTKSGTTNFLNLPNTRFQISVYGFKLSSYHKYDHAFNGKGMIIPQCVTQHRTSCCFWYCHHQHMYLALLASSEDTVIDSKIFFYSCLHTVYESLSRKDYIKPE